ncbi:hypothetical protein D3C73_1396910 [compost metagenome]
MVSQNAFFVKDVFGPKGAVSIVANKASDEGKSDSVASHTQTESLRVHYADLDSANEFTKVDEWVNLSDEPDHQELCNREQLFFQQAIVDNLDLSDSMEDAVNSLRIALACDEAVKTRRMIKL